MFKIIHRYSREDALQDGVLIDITTIAKETGFKVPVAVTATMWNKYIAPDTWPEIAEDIDGRIWDTVWMLLVAIKKSKAQTSQICYSLYYEMPKAEGLIQELVELKAVMCPGDNGEPVITIMLSEED